MHAHQNMILGVHATAMRSSPTGEIATGDSTGIGHPRGPSTACTSHEMLVSMEQPCGALLQAEVATETAQTSTAQGAPAHASQST